MISLERRDGRPLRIGHRGAAALAPENTLASFRAAVEAGVDLIEFDVFALRSGELVVAHSNDLFEVSHGAAHGSVRALSLPALRAVAPELPTLDDALGFFAEEAPFVGAHVDLKVSGRERDIVDALRSFGLEERAFVSSALFRAARRFGQLGSGARFGITVPRAMLGISDENRGASIARPALRVLRRVVPPLVPALLRSSKATALVLHHSVVSPASVRAAHARGAAVVAWTVDTVEDLARVEAAGVDGVVTNDPRVFASTIDT